MIDDFLVIKTITKIKELAKEKDFPIQSKEQQQATTSVTKNKNRDF